MVTHEQLADAVQLHPLPVVNVTFPGPPDDKKLSDEDDKEYVQGVTPLCVIVCVSPSIVIVQVRDVVDVFAATVYDTVALPVPDVGGVMVTQEQLADAVQLHPLPVVNVNDSDALDDEKLSDEEDREYVQGVTPLCVIVCVSPPIVIVQVRDDVEVFADTA